MTVNRLGFIDFIVTPTLLVLGDVLEAILKSLESASKKVRTIPEGGGPEEPLLKRPWVDNLGVNREHWQAKHDSGN